MEQPPRSQFDQIWRDANRAGRRQAARDRFTIRMAAIGAIGVPACVIFGAAVILFQIIRTVGALL